MESYYRNPLNQVDREAELTEGGGDCAYNAFILAVTDKDIANKISFNNIPSNYQSEIKQKLGLSNFKGSLSFGQNLNALRNKAPIELQNKLSPIFRRLAIDIARKDPEYKVKMRELIRSAFTQYVDQQTTSSLRIGIKDDIFYDGEKIRPEFNFIEQKFRQFCGLNLTKEEKTKPEAIDRKIEANSESMLMWWDNEGYNRALDVLEMPRIWSGDLELGLLAKLLEVNLVVYTLDSSLTEVVTQRDQNRGIIPLSEFKNQFPQNYNTLLTQLADYGVIEKWQEGEDSIKICVLSQAHLLQSLEKVSGAEEVQDKMTSVLEEKGNINNKKCPQFSQNVSMEILKQRGIIRSVGTSGEDFVFNVDDETATERLESIWTQKLQDFLFPRIKEKPSIFLSNLYGLHWENTLPVKSAKPTNVPKMSKEKEQKSEESKQESVASQSSSLSNQSLEDALKKLGQGENELDQQPLQDVEEQNKNEKKQNEEEQSDVPNVPSDLPPLEDIHDFNELKRDAVKQDQDKEVKNGPNKMKTGKTLEQEIDELTDVFSKLTEESIQRQQNTENKGNKKSNVKTQSTKNSQPPVKTNMDPVSQSAKPVKNSQPPVKISAVPKPTLSTSSSSPNNVKDEKQEVKPTSAQSHQQALKKRLTEEEWEAYKKQYIEDISKVDPTIAEYKPDPNKWQKWAQDAKQNASIKALEDQGQKENLFQYIKQEKQAGIPYSFNGPKGPIDPNKIINVNEKTQIALDRELAKEMQAEELEELKNLKQRPRNGK